MDMNRDEEHLRLLSIFHYVVAGLGALFSLFPLFYTAMGAFFIFAAHHWPAKPGQEPPPEFVGWIFIAFGSAFFLVGIALAICILITGRSIAHRKHYWFSFVMACIECIFMPFGTVLGVFTVIVLARESVKRLFLADGEASGA
jgi:hypothetical protein